MSNRRLITAIAAISLLAAACGSGEGTTTTGAAGESSTTGAADTTTSGAEAMAGIHTADTDLGTILVDGEGFAIYVFTVDTEGVSTCYEGCADVWPSVPADSEISSDLDASIFGSAARTDGPDQLTVNGQPLYRYTPDANPGDTGGQGVNGVWFVVDANGTMIGLSETSDTTGDDGLDY